MSTPFQVNCTTCKTNFAVTCNNCNAVVSAFYEGPRCPGCGSHITYVTHDCGNEVWRRKITVKYAVCSGRDTVALESAVNKAIENGWIPVGGLTVHGHADVINYPERQMFYQAVIASYPQKA